MATFFLNKFYLSCYYNEIMTTRYKLIGGTKEDHIKKKSLNNRDYQEFKEDILEIHNGNHKKIFEKMCSDSVYTPSILPSVKRIIVFPDIHGDWEYVLNLCKLSKIIDDNLNWTGGKTIVVQTGDQVDRCRPHGKYACDHPKGTYEDENSDIKILKFFNDLNVQAIKAGGRVISLLGNHEINNVLGNMLYVSYKGLKGFENYKDPEYPDKTFSSGEEARIHAFSRGNEYAKLLGCSRLSSVIIGSILFVHAGLIPNMIKKLHIKKKEDLADINILISKWLIGKINKDYIKNIILSSNSLFWTRVLGSIPPNTNASDPTCLKYVSKTLDSLSLGNMVIAHTPQSFVNSSGINNTCGRLWNTDTGSSRAFAVFDKNGEKEKYRKVQCLEILDDNKFNILTM